MKTYVRLKDGRILSLWSDNQSDETMDCYPKDEEFDEGTHLEEVMYSDVDKTDSNLAYLEVR